MTRYEQLRKLQDDFYKQATATTLLNVKKCFYNCYKEIEKIILSLSIEQLEEQL